MTSALEAPAQTVTDIRNLDTDALRRELASALNHTARHLLYLASIWAELERRGEDLSALRSGINVYLPLIAAGSVVPEAVIRFAGNVTLLRAVTALPPDQQRKIAGGDPVLVAEKRGDDFTHRMLPAHSLSFDQVRQVFGERCIRSEAEQIAVITAAKPAAPVERVVKRGNFKADRERGVLLMGRTQLNPTPLAEALADLAGPAEEVEADSPSVSAKLPKGQHERLKLRAAASGKATSQIIRDALRAYGV